ncbi:hypothetical protein CBM2585_B20461 [Cupriavidus taiwanensis]|nr:hypothetical protein CBM2585_B20461 [Cupriavidus taiwanensis]
MCSRSPRGGSKRLRARPSAPSTAQTSAKRSVSRANGVAWSSASRAAMAPLLHSSTHSGVAQRAVDVVRVASVLRAASKRAAQSSLLVMACHLSSAWQAPATRIGMRPRHGDSAHGRAAAVRAGTRMRDYRRREGLGRVPVSRAAAADVRRQRTAAAARQM